MLHLASVQLETRRLVTERGYLGRVRALHKTLATGTHRLHMDQTTPVSGNIAHLHLDCHRADGQCIRIRQFTLPWRIGPYCRAQVVHMYSCCLSNTQHGWGSALTLHSIVDIPNAQFADLPIERVELREAGGHDDKLAKAMTL